MARSLVASALLVALGGVSIGCATLARIEPASRYEAPESTGLVVVDPDFVSIAPIFGRISARLVKGSIERADLLDVVSRDSTSGLVIFSNVPPGKWRLAGIEVELRSGNDTHRMPYSIPRENRDDFTFDVSAGGALYVGARIEDDRRPGRQEVRWYRNTDAKAEQEAWMRVSRVYESTAWGPVVRAKVAGSDSAAGAALSGEHPGEIHYVVGTGDIEGIRSLLATNPRLLEARDPVKNTPLMRAAFNGNEEVFRFLLEQGADVRSTNKHGVTLLHAAVFGRSKPIVEILLARGLSIDAESGQGNTPFDLAAQEGAADMIALLLERGAHPDGGRGGFPPLAFISRYGYRDLAEKLISAGATVDSRDVNGETPLFWVARGGVTLQAEVVLHHLEGDQPRNYPSDGDFVGVAELLIGRGADVNATSNPRQGSHTALHAAAESGRADVTEVLLKRGAEPNARNFFGETPLYVASDSGCASCAEILLDHGAEVDAVTLKNWTPLIGATTRSVSGTREAMRSIAGILIEHGANVNWKTPGGGFGFGRVDFSTPLEEAAHSGDPKLVELLLRAGADPNVPKKNGPTALGWAIKMGHEEVARILREHGAAR